jgi:hypothetical protein
VGLIQRAIDEAGLSTISITQVTEIAALIKPSRSLFVAHPFGLTFGDVGDSATQAAVVERLLQAAESMTEPGIAVSSFKWGKDDTRYRQLRKIKKAPR